MADKVIKMRDYDPKKGQPHLRVTWRSNFFKAGELYTVSSTTAAILLELKSAGDGQPIFEEVKPESKLESVPEPVPESKPKPKAKSKLKAKPRLAPSKGGRGRVR